MGKCKFNKLALAVVACAGLAGPALAQQTSSSIRGNTDAGTAVTITHEPSGTVKTITSNNSGQFTAKGLRVGGPYTVKIGERTIENVYLTLGETYNLGSNAQRNIEEVFVTAAALSGSEFGTKGPSANFDSADLAIAPAINRDIKDLIRIDPRIYVDEARADGIICAGSHPRFSSLTLDGVRMNDLFGLNDNGYPTERIPFSYDSIEQVAVELAPFDVQYGGFTACNINAVSKSGTNEIHGGFFFDYTSDSMRGDSLEGQDIDTGDYTEERYGFNIGLPILKDTLFFFGSYEKLEGVELFEYPGLSRVSQEEIDRIAQITAEVYNYDAGGFSPSMPVEDEKIFMKLDWNINEDHRASLMYNYNDGFSLDQSDTFSSAVTFDSHFYERGAKLESLVSSVFSDWTDDFSTEVRIGKTSLDNRQISLDAASGFAEVQIETESGGTVFIGPDDSRQSNDLDWDAITAKLAATYTTGDHTITAGIEHDDLEIFNLFMQHTVGEYRFQSIDDYEAGLVDRIYYNNSAGTNNPDDVAATFSYSVSSAYVQDEWSVTDDISVLFGLRFEQYGSDDTPRYNPNFEEEYGFSNEQNLDGLSLLQPRLSANWIVNNNVEVRGGVGLYSGGNPNVWISNAYSNDGITQIAVRESAIPDFTTIFDTDLTGEGRPIYDIPQAMFDEVANSTGGDGSVNTTDPDFEIPSEWKFSLGATYQTDSDYVYTADFLMSQKQNAAIVRDLGLTATGETAPDGRPIYTGATFGDYVLTNVDGDDGQAYTLSFATSKDYVSGFSYSAAYAYTESEEVSPMTSSVAGSNYANIAVSDPASPGVANSNYLIRHRFTLKLSYAKAFFRDSETRITLFGSANEGRPYSYVFNRSDGTFGDGNWFSSGRQLLYVPLEDDPNVVYGDDFDLEAFNQLIEGENMTRGEIAERNSFNADWWTKFDFRIEQQVPGITDGHNASAFFVIENLGNLINDDWGVMKQGNFVGEQVVGASINENGQYVYESFREPEAQSIVEDASLWEMRVGFKYEF